MQIVTEVLRRPIQLLHPRAIAVREVKEQEETNLNADAREFQPRRNSAVRADVRIRGINVIDFDESDT